MTCAQRVAVDVVDERGERGALAAARGAGDQHESALLVGDLLEDLAAGRARRSSRMLHRNDAQHHADRAALLEDVAAEAAEAGHAVGEVDFLRFLELLPLRGGHDGGAHGDDVLVVEALRPRWPAQSRRGPASSGRCRP